MRPSTHLPFHPIFTQTSSSRPLPGGQSLPPPVREPPVYLISDSNPIPVTGSSSPLTTNRRAPCCTFSFLTNKPHEVKGSQTFEDQGQNPNFPPNLRSLLSVHRHPGLSGVLVPSSLRLASPEAHVSNACLPVPGPHGPRTVLVVGPWVGTGGSRCSAGGRRSPMGRLAGDSVAVSSDLMSWRGSPRLVGPSKPPLQRARSCIQTSPLFQLLLHPSGAWGLSSSANTKHDGQFLPSTLHVTLAW